MKCSYLLFPLLLTMLAACTPKTTPSAQEPSAPSPPAEALVWLQIDPIQCQGNPWEQGVPYLKDGEDAKACEERLVRNYIKKEFNVELADFRQTQVYENVCDACSCPRGDRIEIQVPESAVTPLALKAWKMAGESE